MMGKRMHHSSKMRVANKASTSADSGKPSSPASHGHGKPARASGTASQGKLRVDPTIAVSTIPYVRISDTANVLPRYAAVAARSVDEPIGMDELDALQLELESLLCDAAMRIRRFQAEIDGIDVIESKRDKNKKAAGKRLQYPIKRKFQDDRPVKPKEHARAPNPKMPKFSKNFNNASSTATHSTFSNDNLVNSDASKKLDLAQLALPKYKFLPYKFWSSVEPYAAPVTHDDVKFLESLLATSSSTSLPPIPPLGRHYSEVWADDNLSDDQNSGKKVSGVSPDSSRKKTEKPAESMITGALTQRLVSALMEENALPYEVPDIKMKPGATPRAVQNNSLMLEKCLRKELVEQGILEPDDLPPLTSPADDEILAEIKKAQAELIVVRKENCRNLRHLIGVCKQELTRNSLRKQLEQVDAECVEIYKKFGAAKQKKRPLTKKEKEDAWRVISEQTRLQKEINALPSTVPNLI